MVAENEKKSIDSIASLPDEADNEEQKSSFFYDASYNRYLAMTFIGTIGILFSFVYDMPGSLQIVIEKTFGIEPYQFEYMYSAYALPNIVIGFFNGMILDKILGLKLGALVLSAIALLAQVVITAGAFCNLYWLMVLGRFILGIGLESLGVANNCFCILWFKGKELGFFFGLLQSLTRAGTPIIYLMDPPIYNSVKETFAKPYVLGLTILPCLFTILIQVINTFFLGELSQRCGLKVKPSAQKGERTINLREIQNFPITFWLISLMVALCNCAFSGFISCSQQLLSSKFDLSNSQANDLTSLFIICSLVASPLIGSLADKIGRDLTINAIGLLLGIIAQMILSCTNWIAYIPLLMYALNFATFNSCAWPLIAYVVQEHQLATAYGTTANIINLTISISNLLAGYLLGHYGTTQTTLFFLLLLILSFVLSIMIWLFDSKDKGVLNMTSKEKQALSEQEQYEIYIKDTMVAFDISQ